MNYTIRNQLIAHLKRNGVDKTLAKAGVFHSVYSEWKNHKRGRRLGDEQLDRLADAMDLCWVLAQRSDPRPKED